MNHGVPAASAAFYARWWQLETWLRQLVYLEFRAKWGTAWADHLMPKGTTGSRMAAKDRAADDTANAYMATPDATDVMSYMDVGLLFRLIRENWKLFEPCLPPRKRWDGWVDELQQIRHRSAHCRRPHDDDLMRIELVLRNLETGAFRSLESHNVRGDLGSVPENDPVVRGWIERRHRDAHLVAHAEQRYDTLIQLEWSVRPWAKYDAGQTITRRQGFFIHCTFHLRSSYVHPLQLWHEFDRSNSLIKSSLVYLLVDSPYNPEFTFAAVDGGKIINDSIAAATYGVLQARRGGSVPEHWMDNWSAVQAKLDHRVLVDSPLNQAYPDQKFSVFGAS